MPTGIRKRVVISCAGYDVVRIVEPIKEYSADIVITFHDMFSDKSTYNIKSSIITAMQKAIEENNPKIFELPIETDVHDFSSIAAELEKVIGWVESLTSDPDIYINISAGTNEFAAASTMCAMLHDNVRIFTVKTLDTTLKPEVLESILFSDGKPTGTAKEVSSPDVIMTCDAKIPEKYLVLGLRVLKECSKDGTPMAKEIISRLIEEGIWLRDEPSPNDNVFYLRDFVEKWIKNGWVEKGQLRNRYRITDKGNMILKTFYNDPDFSF